MKGYLKVKLMSFFFGIFSKILIFILLVNLSHAQDTLQYSFDRPGIADLPYLVQAKHLQFETGIDYFNRGSYNRWQLPIFQFRTGISQNAELRLSVKHFQEDSTTNEKLAPFGWENGIAPITLGTKVLITKEKGWIPEIALMVNILLPFAGDKKYRPKNAGHETLLLFNNNLSARWALNYNLGAIWEGESSNAIWMYAICPSYIFSEKWAIFVEHYAYIPDNEEGEYGYDGGVVFFPKKNVQIDLAGGISQTKSNNYWYIGTGFSYNFKL
ncbi:MAG: hypothetical protein OHK0038_09150 [Flammeovirgaceae bacterium]